MSAGWEDGRLHISGFCGVQIVQRSPVFAKLESLMPSIRRRITQVRSPIEKRRAERELFFWTAYETLALVRQILTVLAVAVVTVYVLVALVDGRLPGGETLLCVIA